jgi:hypothetical protein
VLRPSIRSTASAGLDNFRVYHDRVHLGGSYSCGGQQNRRFCSRWLVSFAPRTEVFLRELLLPRVA